MHLPLIFPSHDWIEAVEKDSNHAHHTARYSNPGAVRSAADVALQPSVGLLPEWRVGNSPDHRNYFNVALTQEGASDP